MLDEDESETVQTTEISLQAIEYLVEAGSTGVEELAAHLNVSPSSAHRHLRALEKFGYVVSENGEYSPGLQFLSVSGHIRAEKPGYTLAKEAVYDLAEETKERVMFVVEQNGERIYMFTRAGENAVKSNVKIGKRGPMHCSAAGKAILAEFPDARVTEIIETRGLPELTENTITEPDALFEELETVREQRIAYNREESTIGLKAVAVPVTEPNGDVLGALMIAATAQKLEGDLFEHELPDLLRGTAQQLELNMKLY